MATWRKAGYGGTESKSGGGKFEAAGSKGNRGIPAGTSAPKASTARGLDVPGKKGDKGVTVPSGFKSAKAPLSE